jgi:hypothetical protein
MPVCRRFFAVRRHHGRYLRPHPGKSASGSQTQSNDHCAAAGIGVVLVPTLIPGVNDHDIGNLVDLAVRLSPGVRGLHFQPVSYFGRFPGRVGDEMRITLPEVLQALERQTGGAVRISHFNPPGCENALCSFHGNFLVLKDGRLMPLTRSSAGCCPQPCLAEDGAKRAVAVTARQWSAPEMPFRILGRSGSAFDAPPCDSPSPPDLNEFLDRVKPTRFPYRPWLFRMPGISICNG